MTLTEPMLVKLAAAPEDRMSAVLAALDGVPQEIQPVKIGAATDGKVRIEDAMAEYGLSRSTVGRKLKRAGIRETMILGGYKWYEPADMKRAIERRAAIA